MATSLCRSDWTSRKGAKPVHAEGLVNVVLVKKHDTWKITAFTFTQK